MTKQTATPRIYLAGPDVFLPNALEMSARKKAICSEHGLLGLWPLDNTLSLNGLEPQAAGYAIAKANEELMQSCAAIIANLTPWDGPSADVGTAFELGYMRALGKPCFAYSNDERLFEQRVLAQVGITAKDAHGHTRTLDGRMVEAFGLHDNLMLDGAVHMSGGLFAAHTTDLTAFKAAAQACAELLKSR